MTLVDGGQNFGKWTASQENWIEELRVMAAKEAPTAAKREEAANPRQTKKPASEALPEPQGPSYLRKLAGGGARAKAR